MQKKFHTLKRQFTVFAGVFGAGWGWGGGRVGGFTVASTFDACMQLNATIYFRPPCTIVGYGS